MRHLTKLTTSLINELRFIQEAVEEHYDMQKDTVKLKTREREIVQARQICMYFAKRHVKLSLSEIGDYFGGKDHATVIHSSKAVKNLIDTDKFLRSDIELIGSIIEPYFNVKITKEDYNQAAIHAFINLSKHLLQWKYKQQEKQSSGKSKSLKILPEICLTSLKTKHNHHPNTIGNLHLQLLNSKMALLKHLRDSTARAYLQR